MEDELIDAYFEFSLDIIKSAGLLITNHLEGYHAFEEKGCDIDFVTEVDRMVEHTLIWKLEERFPDHKFIAEESVAGGAKCVLTDAPTWIIDPIDGTMNFVHGFPHSCISVGLCINKEPVIGIIYNPLMDQIFTAKKGKGAFLNGRQITVSCVKKLSRALIAYEAGTSRDPEKVQCVLDNFEMIIRKAHGVRALGSAALNMAMVALGGVDANFEFGIHAWDIAAGCCIVREAGGVCIDPEGGPLDILSRRILCASTMELAQELAGSLAQYHPERD